MPRGKDSRDHPGRRPVDPRITHSQDTDEAPAHGIPRPSAWTEERRAAYEKAASWGGKGSDSATKDFVDNSVTEDSSDIYTEGEKDTPEDAKEREDLKKERGIW
jgi:hypothetical protein